MLEESGVTATVEVPCEADVAAAKEVACTALAVSPASVEMRIGTQVLEGTCRLQDTAFDAGVQVVLARRFADIKCPAEYSAQRGHTCRCRVVERSASIVAGTVGMLAASTQKPSTLSSRFMWALKWSVAPAISQCMTRCYLACREDLREVALPGGEVLRKVYGDLTRSVRVWQCCCLTRHTRRLCV